jgi:hypothetical protein
MALTSPSGSKIIRTQTISVSQKLDAALFQVPQTVLTSAATIDLNLSVSARYALVISHNVTFNFTNPVIGGGCSIIIIQDSTGGRTATFSGCKFSGGTPTLSTAAAAIDLFGAEFYQHPVGGAVIIIANLLKGFA